MMRTALTAVFGLSLIGSFLLPTSKVEADIVGGDLVLQLEAGKGVVTDASGNVVSWADQSGQGHDASQSSPDNRPKFVSNGLNGGPTLSFDGNARYLDILGQVVTSQQFTIMALVTDNDQTGGYREIFSNWSITSFTESIFLGYTENTRVRFSDSFDGVGSVSDPATPSVISGVSALTDALVYQDGTLLGSKGSPLATRVLNDQYRIGTQGGFEFWNGNIAAILVYDRALTQAEVEQNVQYLTGAAAVPEPSSLVSLVIASACLGLEALRRRRASR